MFRSSVAVVVALGIGAAVIPPSSVEAAHRRRGYSGYGYRGGFYPSFHLGYAPGYYPSFGVGFGHFPVSVGFSYLGGARDPRGSLRFDVHPKSAEVYIDGYYAGIVDDFGKLQLEPGPHDVTLFLDGYRIFEETVYSSAGSTVKIHHEMEPLAQGELAPARPAVPGSRARPAPVPPSSAPWPPPSASPSPSPPPSATSRGTSMSSATTAAFGVLALRTQPSGAEVVIDGEPWLVPEGNERLMLHLPVGRYQIELRKEGYAPFHTSVEVRETETTAVNVLLGPAP